jgi:RNA polymerase sigma-54 factor
MALAPKLEIKQTQSLLLTPELRQAIGLLQMNNLELSEMLEQELQSNPLLERENDRLADTPDNSTPTIDDVNAETPNEYAEDPIAPDMDLSNQYDDADSDIQGDTSFETADWADYNHSKSRRTDDDNFDYVEQKLADEKSLYRLLDEQIFGHFSKPHDRLLAKVLSEHLDAAGYFRGDLTQIAQRLKTSPEKLQSVLAILKTFEPSGLFAESLSECLKIQLEDLQQLTPSFSVLLDNLPLVADRKLKELCKLCSCSPDELSTMLSALKSLNPKPAADWFCTPTSYIIPDVFVKASANGSYRVELNNMSLPRLLINQTYYAELKQNKTTSRYLKENLSHANFLIKALHQRATTILRVTEEIVLRQYRFFEHGVEYLKPLTLKDIAEALEINESTVSRVTSHKYMSTPRGLFELKYFFSQAAGSYIGNTDTSTTAIKHKIKQLIDNETPANILSDDKLVELLGQEGIKIARRTVAKYREALGIETSAQRKRHKRI